MQDFCRCALGSATDIRNPVTLGFSAAPDTAQSARAFEVRETQTGLLPPPPPRKPRRAKINFHLSAFDRKALVKMNPKIFLTRSELAREARLPESRLRRILRERGIAPAATAASGRLSLYPPDLVPEINTLSPRC